MIIDIVRLQEIKDMHASIESCGMSMAWLLSLYDGVDSDLYSLLYNSASTITVSTENVDKIHNYLLTKS